MNQLLASRASATSSVNSALEWWNANPTDIRRPEGSSLHKLAEAWKAGIVVMPHSALPNKSLAEELITGNSQVFLVQHNWAGALGHAIDFQNLEYRLSYPECAFEFDIGGHRVIHIERENVGSVLAIHSVRHWCVFPLLGIEPPPVVRATGLESIFQIVAENVRAMSVAIDASVAELDHVEAPGQLNKARAKAGRPLLKDYHLVNLARRSSPVAQASEVSQGSGKRLHFRRGHWRHLDGEKTWIRWTLAGNADLGFIDKSYKL